MDLKHVSQNGCLIVLRLSILLSVMAHIYLHFYWLFMKSPVTGEAASLWMYYGQDALLDVPGLLLWVYMGIWYIALAGLFVLFNWARWVFLLSLIVGLMITYISGMQVATPGESIAIDLISILSGVIIAIVFFSPLVARFSVSPGSDK